MRYIVLFIFLFVFNVEIYSLISKFLIFDMNSREYQLIMNPDSFSLKEGALTASGVKSYLLERCLNRISNFESGLFSEGGLPENPIEISKLVFDRMQSQVMLKYSEQASSLDLLLINGYYNSLSAALLYNSIMEDLGISCKTILTSTNIYSKLEIDSTDILVDAADPAGFDINPGVSNRVLAVTEYASKRDLLAFFYSELSERSYLLRQYDSSYQYALRSFAIGENIKIISTNLANIVIGYSLYLTDIKKDYSKALSILEEAVLYFPLKDLYLTNYFYVFNKYLDFLTESRLYERAVAEMDRYLILSGRNDAYKMEFYEKLLTKIIKKENDFEKGYDIGRLALSEKSSYDNIRVLMINGYNLLGRKLSDDWKNYPKGEDLMLKWYLLMKNDYFDTILENYYDRIGMKYCFYGYIDRGIEIISNGLNKLPQSKVLSNDISSAANSIALTACSLIKRGYFASGIEYAKKSLKFEPSNESLLSNLQSWYILYARREFLTGDYYKAFSISEEGLELFPSDNRLINYRDLSQKHLK